ncbi:MAG: hypothetical protein GYB31_08140 [Bacteroidetes bacterium]|nr:hypothetical protein [Bacteroidota bacterium]
MFKYTKYTLKKLETLFEEQEYTIRYEKGNFQSGYCIVENRKIAIINKFFDPEARINVLLEILSNMEEVDTQKMSDPSQKLYKDILKLQKANQEEIQSEEE